MKQDSPLSDAIIRLFRSLEEDHALSAREIIHLLEERNLYRLRGKDREAVEESVGELLADRYVFKSAGRSMFSLQREFWMADRQSGGGRRTDRAHLE